MVDLLLGVLLARDGGDVGQRDLMPELGFVLVLVYREQVRAQDEVDWLPGLRGQVRRVWYASRALLAFVLRVRLTTVPSLITRSNSKLPFWLTGDITFRLAWLALMASTRGCASGGSSFMPVGRAWVGFEGVRGTFSAMTAASDKCSACKGQLRALRRARW